MGKDKRNNLCAEIERIVCSPEEIKARVKELGQKITESHINKNPLFIGILKGSVIFLADLVREINLDLKIDFMSVSSYGAGILSGELKINSVPGQDVRGRDIIIVEDILDTGKTLSKLVPLIKEKGAASVKTAVFLDKKEAREVPFEADYVGFTVKNEFLVGYGLDYAEKFRSLPYIGVLRKEYYEKDRKQEENYEYETE